MFMPVFILGENVASKNKNTVREGHGKLPVHSHKLGSITHSSNRISDEVIWHVIPVGSWLYCLASL